MSAQDYYNSAAGQQNPYPGQSQYPAQQGQYPGNQPPYQQPPYQQPSYQQSSYQQPQYQQPPYGSQQNLAPYGQQPNPYNRPTSAHSDSGAYGAPPTYDRPTSAQSANPPTYGANQRGDGQQQGEVGPDGERGFISTVAGGAGGAFLGSKMGNGGAMNKILGGVAGAVAANFIEHKLKENHNQHNNNGGFPGGQYQGPPPPGSYGYGDGHHHHGHHHHDHHHHHQGW